MNNIFFLKISEEFRSNFLSSVVSPEPIAAIVAIYGIHKQLKNTSITKERQKWLTKLKEDSSDFISRINVPKNETELKKLYYKIIFNLNDRDKDIDLYIINILDDFKIKGFNNIDNKEIRKLENYLSDMFKFEWERIKIETSIFTFIPFIGNYYISKKVNDLKYRYKITTNLKHTLFNPRNHKI